MTDAELIQRIRGGDDALFAEVVDRYLGRVWAVCASYVPNRVDCEDVVQESFVQCYRRLDSVRDPVAFARWIGQVARTQCLAFLRASGRRKAAVERYADSLDSDDTLEKSAPDEAAQRAELHRAIRAKIDALPPNYREALSLVYLGGYSVKEAAEFVGVSPDAMKKRLQFGRDKLRDLIADDVEEALGIRRARKELQTRVVAAIPFGTAPWLGATGAVSRALLGGTAGMMKAALIVTAGALVVAGLVFTAAQTGEEIPQSVPVLDGQAFAIAETHEPAAPPTDAVADEEPEDLVVEDAAAETSLVAPKAEPVLARIAKTWAEDDEAARKAVEERLKKTVSIDFGARRTHIEEIAAWLNDFTDTQLALDWRAVAPSEDSPAAVTGRPTASRVVHPDVFPGCVTDGMLPPRKILGVTLEEALETILYPLGLDFVAEPGFIWVSTRERINAEVVREPDERYQQYKLPETLMAKQVFMDFAVSMDSGREVHLSELLTWLYDYTHTHFVLDQRVILPANVVLDEHAPAPPAPKRGGGRVTDGFIYDVVVVDLQFRDALKAILRSMNLTYAVKPGYIWITSPEMLKRESGTAAYRTPDTEEMVEILDRNVPLDFGESLHIASAMRALTEGEGIRFAVDAKVVAPEGNTGYGYGTDGMVPSICVTQLELRHGLDILLRPLNLDYAIKDDVICVSTPERLREGALDKWTVLETGEAPETAEPYGDSAASEKPSTVQTYFTLDATYVGAEGKAKAAFKRGPGRVYHYEEGQQFEDYEVLQITVDPPSVELFNEKDGTVTVLTPSESVPL